MLNDTDTKQTKEKYFLNYVKQMRQTGKLPALCQQRKALVDRLLFDSQVTASLIDIWEEEIRVKDEKSARGKSET